MRKRLSWWKKYADIPAEITLVDEDYRQQFFQSSNENLLDTMSVQVSLGMLLQCYMRSCSFLTFLNAQKNSFMFCLL